MGKLTAKELAAKVIIQQGDLTDMATDAVVNAANNDLLLGGGVAGAIRRRGGEEIQKECNAIGSIPIGYAAITSGGKMKAKHVIHAASMRLGGTTTAETLASSTTHALRIASERGLKTIAFPAIGTGVAMFSMKECAEVMLRTVSTQLQNGTSIQTVYFVLFDENVCDIFKRTWNRVLAEVSAQTPTSL